MSERLLNRIKNIFGTGIVTRVETGIVQLKLATGILNDRIKRVHNYGFMSRPLPGAKGYTLFLGGDTSRGITVCVEDEQYQMELEPGDVAMLDDKGNLIHFNANGIDVVSKQNLNVNITKNVSVNCKNATIEAEENVNVSCKNATVDATKTTINSETEINGKTTINEDVEINGGLKATGAIESDTDVIAAGISGKGHKHTSASPGSPNSPPLP